MTIHQMFTVPPPVAVAELVMKDGAVIRLRRYGKAGRTRLVLSHGNGLAINAYAPFWLPLIHDYDVVVFDMRNHGENPLHDADAHCWESFYSNFEEIFQGLRGHFGEAPTVGAFHSMSSITAMQHALRYGKRWDALCLFDPPVMPPEGHPLHADVLADMEKHTERALRRQDTFDTPEQLALQFRRRASFSLWVPEAAGLLARHTLRPTADGKWTLSCPPALEARIYSTNTDATLFERIPQIDVPLLVIGGDPNSPYASPSAPTVKALHDELGVDYVMVPGTTHFLQYEEPQACRDLLIAFMDRNGL